MFARLGFPVVVILGAKCFPCTAKLVVPVNTRTRVLLYLVAGYGSARRTKYESLLMVFAWLQHRSPIRRALYLALSSPLHAAPASCFSCFVMAPLSGSPRHVAARPQEATVRQESCRAAGDSAKADAARSQGTPQVLSMQHRLAHHGGLSGRHTGLSLLVRMHALH